MLVLKLCQEKCPERITFQVGAKLGDGADGEVFEITDQPSKAIKFGVLYQRWLIDIEGQYKHISNVLNYLIDHPSPTHARVYEHDFLGIYNRKFADQNQDYLLYYYTIEKLLKISDDEYKVFTSLVSHEDLRKEKKFSGRQTKEILEGLARGLDFDMERVIFFHDNFENSPVQHLDVHPRNIMKDAFGNFKLIDFDRTQLIRG